jgi:hypothetical protein
MTREKTPLNIAAFLKSLDDPLRDTVRRGDYGEIILRRLLTRPRPPSTPSPPRGPTSIRK